MRIPTRFFVLLSFLSLALACESNDRAEDVMAQIDVGPAGGMLGKGDASLVVPEGALAAEVTLEIHESTNAPDGGFGTAYEFLPDGQTFEKPVRVAISYDPAALPAGVDASMLRLATTVDGAWVVVPGSHALAETHTVVGEVQHFCSFIVWPLCDDDDPCTEDGFDPVEGCTHVADPSAPGCGDCEPAAETCNGLDDDCDGLVDEDLACEACDEPVPEVCNGLDDDCNGLLDDGATCEIGTCVAGACVADCDAAPESCNGVDDDCDGVVDEDCGPPPCVTHADCAEGQACVAGACVQAHALQATPAALDFGSVMLGACGELSVVVGNAGTEPVVLQALALADQCGDEFGVDGADALPLTLAAGETLLLHVAYCPRFVGTTACEIEVTGDAAVLVIQAEGSGIDGYPADQDGDGFPFPEDCDDANAAVNPAAFDACDDLDNDCDGQVDEEGCSGPCVSHADCAAGQVCVAGMCVVDCAPLPEICNGLDDDCDGQVDEGACVECTADGDCAAGQVCLAPGDNCCSGALCTPDMPFCGTCGTAPGDDDIDADGIPDAMDNCPFVANGDQADLDQDGVGDACDADLDNDGFPSSSDCDDRNPAVNPAAIEACDGLDNDCDGQVDEGC